MGDACVPDYIVLQLARVLHQGSTLREPGEYTPPSPVSIPEDKPKAKDKKSPKKLSRDAGRDKRGSEDYEKVKFGDAEFAAGTTEGGRFLPRERFSYWCFDLLFLICSDTAKGVFGLLLSMKQAC